MSTASPKPPPPRPAAPPTNQTANKKRWSISTGTNATAQKVVLYGPGGVGKTELAANCRQLGMSPVFIDVEDGTGFLDISRINGVESFTDLRDILHSPELFANHDCIVIDSLTKCEELIAAHVVATIPINERGERASSLESYGYGKGLTYVYEQFLLMLADLDALHRAGKTIVGIAHDCTASVPNPSGTDWIRYEPRLQSPSSGKSSIRLRVREWSDHLLFVGYDVAVNREGKGQGSGTRAIYPVELPTHMAKSRSLSRAIVYEKGGSNLWKLLKEGEK